LLVLPVCWTVLTAESMGRVHFWAYPSAKVLSRSTVHYESFVVRTRQVRALVRTENRLSWD
jgi:hypothetical protein